jgi:DNA topoisomerase-1
MVTYSTKKMFKKPQAKYLLIVESPSKTMKIEQYLGSEYQCIATMGHIYTIENMKSIDIANNYAITYSKIKEKREHIKQMDEILAQFLPENIIIATDHDREGEGIAYNIAMEFKLSVGKTRRILFHEITKVALLKAIENPTLINMDIVRAQQARQVLDIIVGHTISPLLWKYICYNKDNPLSAGRCQTPALRLVYDKYKQDETADAVRTSYKITGNFFSRNIEFHFTKELVDEVIAKEFLNDAKNTKYFLSAGSNEEVVSKAPVPFNTSRLLQTVSNKMNISPKRTMQLCQILYQNGYITYMRTENTCYSDVFLKDASAFIEKEMGGKYVGDFSNIQNKDNLNPHEAVRVTNINLQSICCEDMKSVKCEESSEGNGGNDGSGSGSSSGSSSAKTNDGNAKLLNTLYRLIWRNTVESCMTNATYQNSEYRLSPIWTNGGYFSYTVKLPIELGWKKCAEKYADVGEPKDNETDIQNSPASMLLFFTSIANNTKPVHMNYINATTVFHETVRHYTESGLIHKLEENKIGRPSTFSSLIETIQTRKYVVKQDIAGKKYKCNDMKLFSGKSSQIEIIPKEKIVGTEKNKLVIQPLGILAVEFLITNWNALFSYGYTKQMEDKLDYVAEGKVEWYKICDECYKEIKAMTNSVSKQKYNINDLCDLVFQKFGPTLKCKKFGTEYGEDVEYEYKQIRKDIVLNLEQLRSGGYTFEELVENNMVGMWKQKYSIYLKSGQYGNYIECDGKKMNVKELEKPLCEIHMNELEPYLLKMFPEFACNEGNMENLENLEDLEETSGKSAIYKSVDNSKILRVLNNEFSVRKGKFGPYVFYKTDKMHKPKFFNIRDFKEGFYVCNVNVLIDWVKMKYNV